MKIFKFFDLSISICRHPEGYYENTYDIEDIDLSKMALLALFYLEGAMGHYLVQRFALQDDKYFLQTAYPHIRKHPLTLSELMEW